ncbi:14509_t:CDS:2 [Rhizophagus irregularis]|nr:14509_t:CDS:2 [Rhizophagus irregularis]
MPPISELLNDYIIKTKEKLNQREEEGKQICFPNKTDRIVQHLKKCTHFLAAITPEKRNVIFSLLKNNEKELENKRLYNISKFEKC